MISKPGSRGQNPDYPPYRRAFRVNRGAAREKPAQMQRRKRSSRALRVAAAAASLLALPPAARADFAHLVKDDSGAWWFEQNGARWMSFVANHVNDGGADDGVGGRERAVCVAATGNALCGDSLNFAGALGYAPYFNVTQAKHGSVEAWAAAATLDLAAWGFNGVSGWSNTAAESAARSAGMHSFHLLDIGITWPHVSRGLDFDVFSSNFSAQAEAIAAAAIPPRASDESLIGWQTDNELNFGALGLSAYLNGFADSEGGAACVAWLQARYATLAAINAAWGTSATTWTGSPTGIGYHLAHDAGVKRAAVAADDAEWTAAVMDRYYNVTVGLIRKYDPNHLVSGVRFSQTTDQVLAVAARYCDLLDLHDYGDLPDITKMQAIYAATGRPMVLGEFSFTAADSNMPNTHGARANNPEVTQTARARKYELYAAALIEQPFVLGYGWRVFLAHRDMPAHFDAKTLTLFSHPILFLLFAGGSKYCRRNPANAPFQPQPPNPA